LGLGIFGTSDKAGRVIPNKVFEALAMKLPLITGDSPAIRELLTDGENVLLVPRGDAQALANRILWAREHYAQVREIAERGYKLFHRDASPAAVSETIRVELDQLLHHSPNGPWNASTEPVSLVRTMK
jgi:glycosyltransferase involved in cell wall biosynthesis